MMGRSFWTDCHKCKLRIYVMAGSPGWSVKKMNRAGWGKIQIRPNGLDFYWLCPDCLAEYREEKKVAHGKQL